MIYSRLTSSSWQSNLYSVTTDGSSTAVVAGMEGRKRYIGVAAGRVIYENFRLGETRDIFSAQIDGTGAIAVANSPDDEVASAILGEQIVFERTAPSAASDLYIARADGSRITTLANTADIERFGGIHGERVFYYRAPPLPGTLAELHGIRSDGTQDILLASTMPPTESLEYSGATNQRVVYTAIAPDTYLDLYSVNVDGSGTVALATSDVLDVFAAIAGDRVIYHKGGVSPRLISVRVDGTGAVDLDDTGLHVEFAAQVGTRLLYHRFPGSGTTGDCDLVAVNADGTERITLAGSPDREVFAGVVADLVVYYRTAQGDDDLYAVKADGTGLVTLAATADNEAFAGSVGERIIYRRSAPEVWDHPTQRDVLAVNIDGTRTTVLADSSDWEVPVGIAGGRVIYDRFNSQDASVGGLYAVDPDGMRTTLLAPATADDRPVFEGVVTF